MQGRRPVPHRQDPHRLLGVRRATDTSDDLWTWIYIRVIVHVAETYNRTSVREQVDSSSARSSTSTSWTSVPGYTMGSIYRAVLSVAGVDYADVRWLTPEPPPSESTPEGETTPDPPAWPLRPTSPSSREPGRSRRQPLLLRGCTTSTTSHRTYVAGLLASGQQLSAITGISRQNDLNDLTLGDHILMRPFSNAWAWWDLIVSGATGPNERHPGVHTGSCDGRPYRRHC